MAATASLPGPRERFPGAHLLAFRRDPLAFLGDLHHAYGDVVAYRLWPERAVLVTHPAMIREVLVTQHRHVVKARRGRVDRQFLGAGLLSSEGEVHRRQRRQVQPAFAPHRIEQYASVMTAYGTRLGQQWRDGDTRDVAQAMAQVTLAIVGKALFGAELDAEAPHIGAALTTLMQHVPRSSLPLFRLPLAALRPRVRRAARDLYATVARLIQARQADGTDTGDVLAMLLQAPSAGDASPGMTAKQLQDEALTLLLAGHETTALALSWTWYLLAQHPAVEAALHTELATRLGGRAPTAADLPHLAYTRRVLTEAMRLYPPAWMLTRRAVRPITLGDYTVPAGTVLILSPYVTQRDARWFPDPTVFHPDRWADSDPSPHAPFAYFPFGGGLRHCLGEGFAWMEGVLLLATIAQQWQLRLVPGHPVVPAPLVTLRLKHGLPMTLTRRA